METFPELGQIAAEVMATLGLAVLVTALVQLGKRFKIIPDSFAGSAATILNIVGFLVLTFVVQVFGFDLEGDAAQSIFGSLRLLGELIISVLGSPLVYDGMKKASVVGFRKEQTQ